MYSHSLVEYLFLSSEKARSTGAAPHRTATELYCDDDISLKERLQRAEAVSLQTPLSSASSCIHTFSRLVMHYQQKMQSC